MPSLRQRLRRAMTSRAGSRRTNLELGRIADCLERIAAKYVPLPTPEAGPTPLSDQWDLVDPIKEEDYALLEHLEEAFAAATGRQPSEEELLGQFDEERHREDQVEDLRREEEQVN